MKFNLKQARLHNHAEWFDIYEFPSKNPSAFIKVATHPEGAQILKHEHAVLQRLKLNYIPQILDFIDGADNDRVQLALKAIRGRSLHGVMGLAEFRKILPQVLQIVLQVHQQGYIHGDLKPEHFLKNQSDEIFLIDFSLSAKVGDKIKAGGSIFYLAPERWVEGEASFSSDLYALGAVFFEWLTGRKIFNDSSLVLQARAHLLEPPPTLNQILPAAPGQLSWSIARLLAKDPQDRYQNIIELIESLLPLWPELQALLPDAFFKKSLAALQKQSLSYVEIQRKSIEQLQALPARSEEETQTLIELLLSIGEAKSALDYLIASGLKQKVSLLARCYVRLANYEKVITLSQNKFSDLIDEAQFLNALATAQFNLGKKSEALTTFERAYTLVKTIQDPKLNSVVLNNLATALLEEHAYEKALGYYQEAESLAKQHRNDPILALVFAGFGYAYHKKAEAEQAKGFYQKAIQLYKNLGLGLELIKVQLNWVSLLMGQKKFHQAKEQLHLLLIQTKNRKLTEQEAYAQLLLGDTLWELHQKKAAIVCYREALIHYRALDLSSKIKFVENKLKIAQSLEEVVMDPEVLLKIGARIQREEDPKNLPQVILESMMTLTHAERGMIFLKKTSGTFVVLARGMGSQKNGEINLEKVPMISKSVAMDCLKTAEPIITLDAEHDERFQLSQSIHALKLKSILCLPLKYEGTVLGVIYLDHTFQPNIFANESIRVLTPLALQMAYALRNSEEKFHYQNKIKELEKKVTGQNRDLTLKYNYQAIIGQSDKMRDVLAKVDRVTEVDIPVLILGESGVGKELIAKAIHYNGPRKLREFVGINCAAIPENLLESELFGHEKGAFTDAKQEKVGLFELAHQGTLFLDEIGDMPLAMQAKILRVLQEGKIRRIGGRQEIAVDVRVIAATHHHLRKWVASKKFRRDLYYRLSVVEINIPALRERIEDIPELAQHFLAQYNQRYKQNIKITPLALRELMAMPLPGNVRQLQNLVFQAAVFSQKGKIESFRSHEQEIVDPSARQRHFEADEVNLEKLGLTKAKQQFEKVAIQIILTKCGGNISRSAKLLKVARPQLSLLVSKYGLKRSS